MGRGDFRPSVAAKRLNGFQLNLEYITKLGLGPPMLNYVVLRQREWSRRSRDISHVSVLVW